MGAQHTARAWGLVDVHGTLHIDKVMASRAEAWGLLVDERTYWDGSAQHTHDIPTLKKEGWRCVRITLAWDDPPPPRDRE